MDYVTINEDVIRVDELVVKVSSPTCGGTSIFLGTTRDNFADKKVLRLEYEAYVPMAVSEMKKICGEIREKWPVENIAIQHRLGVVPVLEISVAIVISSPHRKESIAAVEYCIDTLKAKVPIWKKWSEHILRYSPESYDAGKYVSAIFWRATRRGVWDSITAGDQFSNSN